MFGRLAAPMAKRKLCTPILRRPRLRMTTRRSTRGPLGQPFSPSSASASGRREMAVLFLARSAQYAASRSPRSAHTSL